MPSGSSLSSGSALSGVGSSPPGSGAFGNDAPAAARGLAAPPGAAAVAGASPGAVLAVAPACGEATPGAVRGAHAGSAIRLRAVQQPARTLIGARFPRESSPMQPIVRTRRGQWGTGQVEGWKKRVLGWLSGHRALR